MATIPKQTTTQPVTITPSEKKVGIDGKIITSKNIKTYHSLLLKEFEGHEIGTYQIIWGDTLWKIALKFNTSAHTLYVLNALDNPDLIIAGQKLKIVKNFILPKEKTEKIITNAMKSKTSLDNHKYNQNPSYSFLEKYELILYPICSINLLKEEKI